MKETCRSRVALSALVVLFVASCAHPQKTRPYPDERYTNETESEDFRPRPGFEDVPPGDSNGERDEPASPSGEETGPSRDEDFTPPRDEDFIRPGRNEDIEPRTGFERETLVLPEKDPELVVAAEEAAGRDTPREVAATLIVNGRPLGARVSLSGTVQEGSGNRWTVEDTGIKLKLDFLSWVAAPVLRGALGGKSLSEVTANRVVYPSGVAVGISVRQHGVLVYLAEEIRDRAPLDAKDRGGFRFEQVETDDGPPDFQNAGRKAFRVPVRVSVDGEEVQLSPGETATLRGSKASYGVRILTSLHSVSERSRYAFEGPVRHIKYVVWRLGN